MSRQSIQRFVDRAFLKAEPTNAAIVQSNISMSWAELEARTRVLAASLAGASLGKGKRIAVLTNDRVAMIVSMLAIFRAGAVFVPFDAAHPREQLLKMCQVAEPSALISDDSCSDEEKSAIGASIATQLSLADIPLNAELPPDIEKTSPDDPAYIYFTSGTTGTPKAILGRSGGLVHFIEWEVSSLDLPKGIRVAQTTTPGHDPFLRDILVPLSRGGSIMIPPERNTILVPRDLVDWVSTSDANLLHMTPTIFRNLCGGRLRAEDAPNLNWLLIAGEKLNTVDVQGWYQQFGHQAALYNLYGPTETTLAKFCHKISANDLNTPIVPIGRPISETEFAVLDENGAPCARGTVGELEIRTRHASLGYFNSAAQGGFQFCDGDAVVRYRTGDFVSQQADDTLSFVGRRDRQVKLLGERIELAEVESAILSATPLRSCHVLVAPGASNADELVAFYIDDGSEAQEAFDRSALTHILSPARIPRRFIPVAAFPLTANGKMDEAVLLRMADAAGTGVAPVDEAETQANGLTEQLFEIWRSVLSHDDFGTDDAFMTVGGDSMTIMQLVMQVEENFGYELSLWDVFEDLTVNKLTTLIEEAA
ncbi:amino acid adenylation domain-containing protein [Phaeobacter sp. B1627]|uniref:non-ribosomal peptide synthetase n=1 Tax=Phaeobacter sp. B1627 TaxID=2583809 RepID=UPI00159EC906|nr:amino acid adenylation domain-containing protein [Phaeobacter sp. B1627]